MTGTVKEKTPMMLWSKIGTVQIPDTDIELEMCVTEPLRNPFVKHPDGRCFIISWEQIAEMAVNAFNKPA